MEQGNILAEQGIIFKGKGNSRASAGYSICLCEELRIRHGQAFRRLESLAGMP
jgi:hypothetical protein